MNDMKTLKKILIFTTLVAISLSVLASCDTYIAGKDPVGANELGTVRVNDGDYVIILDQSGEYTFKNMEDELYRIHAEEDGQRVIVTYYFADGSHRPGSPIDIYKVLTKDIFEMNEAAEDSIGNDRINVESAWISGGYINIRFGYYASGMKSHFINLVSYPQGSGDVPVTDAPYFELRHNDFNDGWNYWMEDYVSFPADFDTESCDRIYIGYTNYYGQKNIIELSKNGSAPDGTGVTTGDLRVKLQ